MFEDLRCLLAGPDGPGVDNTPPRSKYFLAWGAESFTSGQHYWEVDVAGYCNWAIGLRNDSWARESDTALDSRGIFLLLCIKGNSRYSLFTSFPLLPQYVKKPLGQVGMFLDYDGGILSFFNVANSSLICSFLYCSFSSPLKPFLCSRYPWSEVKTLTLGVRNVNSWGCYVKCPLDFLKLHLSLSNVLFDFFKFAMLSV